MKILLSCESPAFSVSEHYITTLVLLFRPNEKFGINERDTLSVSLSEESGVCNGCATLSESGSTVSHTECLPVAHFSPTVDRAKAFAGSLLRGLFYKTDGYAPPWGSLTGVRPARFALEFLRNGFSPDEVRAILTEQFGVFPEKAALALRVAEVDRAHLAQQTPHSVSFYVGIPFCPTRCRYCSFTSYATDGLRALLPDYLTALVEELRQYADAARRYALVPKSLYVGGGTPTVLSEKQLGTFLEQLHEILPMRDFSEITFEAGRPDTVTIEKLRLLKEYGISRVCINTQTTNDAILSSIGRSHTAADYFHAVEAAQAVGFSVINTDLIAGLPGESVESFAKSLREVSALSTENITVHAFTLKKSSDYTVNGIRLSPSDPKIAAMLALTGEAMDKAGYFPYYTYRQKNTGGNFENVGYAHSENAICRYNIDMMEEFHTVLAAGAGASGKLVADDLSHVRKLHNPKYPYEYLTGRDYIMENVKEMAAFFA